ncbi:MAG: hypothetical protein IKF83_00110 [Clostridia bacterium]|nr:hypothetical protein [Clostridia bacterium]
MKNFKTALFILLAVAIVILIIFLVKNITNNNDTKENEKLISEIKYMDNKLTYLLNSVNNITLENFKISVSKTSVGSKNQAESEKDGGQEQYSSSSSSGGQSESSSKSQESSNSTTNTTAEQYGLKEQRILTNHDTTDWEAIKNDIEILYSTIPTMTLDLYSMNINQEQILNFNKELDELAVISKEENKEKTLMKLANLYRYLPAYVNSLPNNTEYANLLDTKSNVFNSYVFASIDNWEECKKYIGKAIESYSMELSRISDKENYYNTNKTFIILNELKNAADIGNKDVYFIKYKNFLEETEKQDK